MQQFQLHLLGEWAECVRGAGHHCLAHNIRSIRDQLKRQRSARTGTEHIDWLAEVIANCLGMPLGDLGERRARSHTRPAIGEVNLEAGSSQRGQCSQS
jgi:hypothetical protein